MEETSQFNMGAMTMVRIDRSINAIAYCRTTLYLKGMPLHMQGLLYQIELYDELDPWLTKKERTYANDNFLKIFDKYPIINTGHSFILPRPTEIAMVRFKRWCMRKLKEKGILSLMGDRPEEAFT